MSRELKDAMQRAEDSARRAVVAETALDELQRRAMDFERVRRNMHNMIQVPFHPISDSRCQITPKVNF